VGKRIKGQPVTAGEMLPFDGEADFEATSQLMTNRVRFEQLSPAARARLAETLVAAPLAQLVEGKANLEDGFQEWLATAIDAVESVRAKGTCAICHNPYEEGEDKMEQRLDWYEDGKKFYGEPTGEDAHARCIRRLREGGDAETKPMF
jgi:hypothetical protein